MVNTIHPVDTTSGAPSYSGRMLRQVGSVAFTGATPPRPLGARSGVRPNTGVVVYANSTTWTVGPHAGILDMEAALESGPTLYSIDAQVSGALRAADSFARIDLVWVRQDIPLEDGAAAPAVVFGYTYGTVASTAPATPARCMVLAWINVPASGGGGPTVTWKAPVAVAAGAPIPVGSQAERDALTGFKGLQVIRLDLSGAPTQVHDGSSWVMAGSTDVTSQITKPSGSCVTSWQAIQVGKLVALQLVIAGTGSSYAAWATIPGLTVPAGLLPTYDAGAGLAWTSFNVSLSATSGAINLATNVSTTFNTGTYTMTLTWITA